MKYSDVTGFVLAGGKSKRLGRDKRILRLWKETLLERTWKLLNELIGSEPLIVGDNLSSLGLNPRSIIADALPGRGPLSGLVASLGYCPSSWGLVLAVDMPLLRKTELRKLLDNMDDDYDVVALSINETPEPLAALYHRRKYSFWRERLFRGQLSIRDGIRNLEWKAVMLDKNSVAVSNLNNPEDIDNILRG
ncbi:MAG: molybdenum cofactor guanylyltransferase [candidate division Zixibacteria bacterium]